MLLRQLFEPKLAQYAYLVGCPRTKQALVIDPQRDVDRYVAAAEDEGLTLVAAVETHIHADFLSGARQLAARGLRVYLSDEGGSDWRYTWPAAGDDVVLLTHCDKFSVGGVELTAIHSPGHTPEHLAFLVTDRGSGADAPMGLLSGDFVFVGDTGRPDLLETAAGEVGAREPAARQLYRSVQDFLALQDYLQVWPGHGAGSACGKALGAVPESTVGYERRFSPALDAAARGERAFVEFILDGQPEPPLYFARMKRLNKTGPPLLDALPRPARLDADGLAEWAERDGVQVLDTRADRQAFMGSHLRGSLFAPFDKQFNTTAGAYLDPERPVVLILDEEKVEEAVRDLVRVGVDRIEAFVPPDEAHALAVARPALFAAIPEASFEDVARRRAEPGVTVVDVRRADEFGAGHVPGALHAPHIRLPEHVAALPKGNTLLVHCQSGIRAAVASALLAARGFDVVYVNDSFPRYAEPVVT